jgi:hypothetical protein
MLAQWIWNLPLELAHALHPLPLRTTQGACPQSSEPVRPAEPAESRSSGPPPFARPSFTGGCAGSAFSRQSRGVAQLLTRSLLKNDDVNETAPCAFCMQRASVTAVPALLASRVRESPEPPSSPDGSAPFFGRSLRALHLRLPLRLYPLSLFLILVRCSGAIGMGATLSSAGGAETAWSPAC